MSLTFYPADSETGIGRYVHWQSVPEGEDTTTGMTGVEIGTYRVAEVEDAAVVLEEFRGITDGKGNFVMPVEPGAYQLEVMIPGFQAAFVSHDEDQPLTSHMEEARIFDVQTSTEVNVALGGGSGGPSDMAAGMERAKVAITGTVTDASGQAVSGLLVMMQPEFDPHSDSNGDWEEVMTANDGSFSVSVLPGRYRIEMQTKYWDWDTGEEKILEDAAGVPLNLIAGFSDGQGGVNPDWEGANIFSLFYERTINTKMSAGVTLDGHIRKAGEADAGPEAVVGAEVNVHTLNFESSFWTTTGADGYFSVNVNPGKTYVVEVWPAWCEEPMPGDEESQVAFDTCNASRVDFMGGNVIVTKNDVVGADGEPLLDESGKSTVITRSRRGEPVIVASVAEAAGVVSMSNAPSIGGKILGVWDPEKVTQFKVDHSLHLMPMIDEGKKLSGSLMVGDTAVGIGDAWVESGFGGTPTKRSEEERGSFTLVVPSSSGGDETGGTFRLHIWPPWCDSFASDGDESGSEFDACETNKVDFMGGVVVLSEGVYTLSTDDASAVEFNMDGSNWPSEGLVVRTRAGIAITGKVTDGDGVGLKNVWVDAWSHTTFNGNGASTDSDGNFSISVASPPEGREVYYEVGIWAPEYVASEPVLVKVVASGVTGIYQVDWEGSGDPEEDGEAAGGPRPGTPIDEGEAPSVAFSLSKGNTVSGRVVGATGEGLPWVWVDLHDRRFTKFFGASTDEDGYYEASVEPGRYVAVVWGDGENLRDTWYNQATDERDATLIDAREGQSQNINFRMTSGATISGTITGGTTGDVFVSVWSQRTKSWGGKDVTLDSSGTTAFTISGLREADDYRLEWHSDSYRSGFYGGTLNETASGPVGWGKAAKLSTTNGSISGVNISLGSGTNLALTVTGMQSGEGVEASVWSDALGQGGWAEAKVDATTGVATLVISGLDSTGKDYRLFVSSSVGTYKMGNFKGTPVTTTDEAPATDGDSTTTDAGSLVGWDQATEIDMASNVSVKVAMDTGGTISGTITGLSSGQMAWVDAFSERTHGWGGTEVKGRSDGSPVTYTLTGLKRARDYRISIDGDGVKSGFYSGSTTLAHWENARRVDIKTVPDGQDNGNASGIDMTLSAGISIAGSIKGSDESRGLKTDEWAWVDAWSDSTFSWSGTTVEASTETSGVTVAYELKGLASASDYEVSLDVEGYVRQLKEGVDATAAVTGIDFTLSTGGKISGSISGLTASEFVWLDAFSPKTGAWGGVGEVADSSGAVTYTIDGLSAASDYVVVLMTGGKRFYYKEGGGITPLWKDRAGVTVTSGTTEDINFDLSTASSALFKLSGTVTLNPASDDQVVEIMAWSEDGAGAQVIKVGGGRFTLKSLPSTTYMVEVFADGYAPQRIKTATVASGVIDSSTLAWTSGWNDMGTVAVSADTTGLDVTLSTGFTLSGTVKDSSGTALTGVWVNAWNDTSAIGSGAVTDSSGAYSIEGLPATTGSEVYTVEVWSSSGTVSQSQALTADTTLNLDMAAKESGGISGSVVNSSQVAKAGALVLVFDSTGAQVASTATDSTGAFKVDGLKSGTYTVKVFGDENLSTTYDYNATSVEVSGSVNAVETPLELTAPSGS